MIIISFLSEQMYIIIIITSIYPGITQGVLRTKLLDAPEQIECLLFVADNNNDYQSINCEVIGIYRKFQCLCYQPGQNATFLSWP